MNKNLAIVGGAAALVGIILIAQKVAGAPAGTCFLASADKYYYATWLGSDRYLPNAFSEEAWSVIHVVEYFDPDEQEWLPPADPTHHSLLHAQRIRFIVQSPVEVCGFRLD